MKKSLIAAPALAAIALGAASMPASAGVVGTGLGGVGAHADTQIAEHLRLALSPQALLLALLALIVSPNPRRRPRLGAAFF
jgi:hypothetical protein